MSTAMFPLLVGIGLLGILVILIGIFPSQEDRSRAFPRTVSKAFSRAKRYLTRRNLIAAGAGLALGITLWIVSGWPVMILAGPVFAIIVPLLVGGPGDTVDVDKLQALETWTRSLSGTITGGSVGLETALQTSMKSAPPAIHKDVERLSARLTSRWPIDDALEAFADDLHDATGDLVVAQLLLAARERGSGLGAALDDLAADVFDEVKNRREIAADRVKPQRTIQVITGITLAALCAFPFLGQSQFFASYQTPLGQLLLAMWMTLYIGALYFLKRLTKNKPLPRILANPNAEKS